MENCSHSIGSNTINGVFGDLTDRGMWLTVSPKRQTGLPNHIPNRCVDQHKQGAWQETSLRLHWINQKSARDKMAGKWAVSMDPPRTGVDPACTDLAHRWERAEQSEAATLWRHWE